MNKANALSTGEKRRYSPRGRPVKRSQQIKRERLQIKCYDVILRGEEAKLARKLQQKRYEETMKYREEHKDEERWWQWG